MHDGRLSAIVRVLCSVPQGSVLGPRLFIVYTADLAHKANLALCARSAVYTIRRDAITSAVNRLQQCITDIGCWMSANRLKLNTDKTELLWISSKYNLSVLQGCGPALQLGSDVVEPCTDHAQLLKVTLSALCRPHSRQTRLQCQRSLLLLATSGSAPSGPAVF